MLRKPLELPPEIAMKFRDDMRAFLSEINSIKRDEIAARQLDALREYENNLRLSDVKELFLWMQDYA